MGKRDRIKRFIKDCSHPSVAAASGNVLEPHLNDSTDIANGASLTGNRSQSAPGRDLWGLALENLASEDKEAIMLQIKSDSKLDVLRQLHAVAVKKRNYCEDHMWKFELHGRQIILRDVAEKIIIWIDKFKRIGDVIVNFDPAHAALPWAGVRFLLEVTVAESQQMGALLTGVEKMTDLIGRCQIYEALYLEVEQFDQEWQQAILNLTSALVSLYAAMLSFLARALRSYDQPAINRTLRAILNPAEMIGFLDKCQSLENNLAVEVDNCERLHTHRFQASSKESTQKLEQLLADLRKPMLRVDSRVATLCERSDGSERLSILEWISSIRYEENHHFACQGRTSGTGEWLLRHERYREWRASSASMILWLHGDPGVGKTKLVSAVVNDLLETFEQLPNDEAFAYFYCDRNQSDRREPALILSSFVRQLSTYQNTIPRSTVQMYNQKRQRGFASGKLKMKESQTILADLFRMYPQSTLVVDALDECDENTRSDFIDILDKFVDESPTPIKILISSRQDRDIKHRFEDGPNLAIRAIDNRKDIAMFVSHEIKKFRQDISPELKELICNTLVERSEGMFQWAALQIPMLCKLRANDIRKQLGRLPKTLKKAYDDLYIRIQSQEESTPTIANRAFQWVMCSCRPLSPAELVTAICQDPDTDEIDEIDIDIEFVLEACHNLLVVDQELNICRFSHLSVQEYFESHHWSSCETDSLVGKVCLSLLINNNSTAQKQVAQRTKKKDSDNGAHRFLEYACLHWGTHVQRLEEKGIIENRLTALLKQFFGSSNQSSLAYQNWHKMVAKYFDRKYLGYRYDLPLRKDYRQLSPCSWASLTIVTLGFSKSVRDWWTVGIADINRKNSTGHSLLMVGAMKGRTSIVEYLLEKGADVNTSGGRYSSPLQAASELGHESVVRLLLDKGADVNMVRVMYGSALQAASFNGFQSVAQMLLDKGADVNAKSRVYGAALQAASFSGFKSIVQMLLDKGADVNGSGGEYGNALQAASCSGAESVVQLLLDNGADVNATGGKYGSAMEAASTHGHEDVVQLLQEAMKSQ